MNWFFSNSAGGQEGPVTELELGNLIKDRKLTRDTLVWNDTLPEWVALSATSLAALLPASPPPMPAAVPPPMPARIPAPEASAQTFEAGQKTSLLYGVRVANEFQWSFYRRRIWAFLIDVAIILLAARIFDDFGTIPYYAVFFLLFSFRDTHKGQSWGKKICKLQVVDKATGKPGGAKESLSRNWILSVPILNWVTQIIALVQGWNGPRLGDSWAGTKVIWLQHADEPAFACGASENHS